jgi:hypothetical protein
MSEDSSLFRDLNHRIELSDPLPLYEAKMVHHFDHRWATYVGDGDDSRDMTDDEKGDPRREPQPRYWVDRTEVESKLADKDWHRGWLLGFRNITNATNERSAIFCAVPRVGVGHSMPLIFPSVETGPLLCFLGLLSSLTFDFVVRQKLGGTNFTYGYIKQIAVPGPESFSDQDVDLIAPKVLELTFTSEAMRPLWSDTVAQNQRWDKRTGADRGQPWRWNPERRAILRAELDAIYARLYGLSREDLRYILDPTEVMGSDYPSESFRVLKDKEIRHFGEYRTRRLVLEAWDRMEQGEL